MIKLLRNISNCKMPSVQFIEPLSPENVVVFEIVEKLDLLEHRVPVCPVLVSLQHHHLVLRLVDNLKY